MTLEIAVTAALGELRTMLQADGYDLSVQMPTEASLLIRVLATEQACADCLVPKETFRQIILDSLGPLQPANVGIAYPGDEATSV